jgi:hypothetical protein
MKKKYPGRIIHELWPARFMEELETMIKTVQKIAENPDVKVLIIYQAVPGTNAAVDKFIESREARGVSKDDYLIIYCYPQEDLSEITARADIILEDDFLEMGVAMPKLAAKMGAKTFIHYSFPRHTAQPIVAARMEILAAECAKLGIDYVELIAPDPMHEAGDAGAFDFILEDVPKQVAKYGKDTAFFCTQTRMQIPLIEAVLAEGAIYPSPCSQPSPFLGFPEALELKSTATNPETGYYDADISDPAVTQAAMEDIRQILVDAGAGGRFATWPVEPIMLNTWAATEYAFKWMEGKTDGKVDKQAFIDCMEAYTGPGVSIRPYTKDGITYDNLWLFMEPYVIFK